MFFKKLEKLKDFNFDNDTIDKLDECLNDLYQRKIYRFSPRIISETTGLKKEVLQKILLRASQLKVLVTSYEIECPEGDSDFSVSSIHKIPWGVELQCRVCDTIYTPSISNIWLTFSIGKKPTPKA